MNAKVVVCLLSFVVVMGLHVCGVLAGPPEKEAPPWRPTVEVAKGVSVEERIAMGVEEPTWVKEHGRVHPDVRAALKEQKDLERNMYKDPKDPKANLAALFQFNRPGGFLGYVYVVVHLDHKQQGKVDSTENRAAIKALQSSVLSKLNAAEFSLWLRFPNRAALLGWVNQAGLDKLTKNEKVLAVGIDTKPYPNEKPPQFYSKGGENTGGGLPKISAQVVAALEKVDEVMVIVNVQGGGTAEAMRDENWKTVQGVQDRVLSHLSAEEFRVLGRIEGGHVTGWLAKAGLAKLSEHPDVVGVGLPGPPIRMPAFRGTSPRP